jgi:hypothetical protein
MILVNKIKIKTFNNRKLKYYSDLGYAINNEFFLVNIDDLNKGSREIVPVECDYCQKNVYISYKEYIRNISIGGIYACSNKCGSIKAKNSNIIKYNVDYPMMLTEIQDKATKTNISKYGVKYLQQSDEIKEITKINNIKKWGVDHISKSEIVRLKTSKISHDLNYIKYISNSISLFKCDLGLEHYFEINNDNYYHRKKSKNSLCTICNPIGDSSSIKEKELYNFIKQIYNGKIMQSYRDGLEIDIYLPEMNLGFEFNGLYWHSELYKDKLYHLNKTNYFKEKGINIVHIWETDWSNKKDIVKSKIIKLLKLNNNKVYDKLEIKEIKSNNIIKLFFTKNELVFNYRSNIKIGVYDNNDLLSLITFKKIKNKENEWILSNFSNKINYNNNDTFNIMINYFVEKYNPKSITTNLNNDWPINTIYFEMGFKVIGKPKITFKYLSDGKRINKIWNSGKIKLLLNLYD